MRDKKYAILSMDVEDWYHLDYFRGKQVDRSVSMLDGFTNYLDLLDEFSIKTTFFVLSELVESAREGILRASGTGNEIACHGKDHTRPMAIHPNRFREELAEAKDELSNLIGKEVLGYRAPCYSIDDDRYRIVQEAGFKYSSSRMDVPAHPLYGSLDLSEFSEPLDGLYQHDGFYEFSLSTERVLGRNVAISGGGWVRLFPWRLFMRPLISRYLGTAEIYSLYIHPFEFSRFPMPHVADASLLTSVRSRRGLGSVEGRIRQLIQMLKNCGFEFKTYAEIVELMEATRLSGTRPAAPADSEPRISRKTTWEQNG